MDKRQQQQQQQLYNNKEKDNNRRREREQQSVAYFQGYDLRSLPMQRDNCVCVWSRVTEKLLSIPQRMLKFTLCVASHDDPRRKACRVCKGCGGQNLLEINKID